MEGFCFATESETPPHAFSIKKTSCLKPLKSSQNAFVCLYVVLSPLALSLEIIMRTVTVSGCLHLTIIWSLCVRVSYGVFDTLKIQVSILFVIDFVFYITNMNT